MALPFQPESLESIKARFPMAIAKPFDVLGGITGKSGPFPLRAHVFDFFDGTRMICSRDMHVDRNVIHFSFSCEPGFPISNSPSLTHFVAHCMEIMQDFYQGEVLISMFSKKAWHCFLLEK
jgi:hypothetical protein